MKAVKKIIVISLCALALSACGGSNSSETSQTLPVTPVSLVPSFTNHDQCANPNLNIGQIGIPGNTACPYQGAYNPNIGYQGYAFHYQVGVGFRIDFGWDYNDMCPQIGQRPIFQNGGFSHCTGVNPLFAQVDEEWYSQPNTGECAGDQLNTAVTRCRAQLQPMHVPAYSNFAAPQVQPTPVDPVLDL